MYYHLSMKSQQLLFAVDTDGGGIQFVLPLFEPLFDIAPLLPELDSVAKLRVLSFPTISIVASTPRIDMP